MRLLNYFKNKFLKRKRSHSAWIFNNKSLDSRRREDGISGFMRLRNEEDYLAVAIESHIEFLDELILVHNRCTDKTPNIAEMMRKKYPDKIKVYHYKPHVYPQGSKEHEMLPANSENSLVNYYNFALSKTTKKIAVKIDGDHAAIPEKFKTITDKIRKDGLKVFLTFKGINLWDSQGKVYVNGNRALTSGNDIGFFRVSNKTYFVHDKTYEVFKCNLRKEFAGILFFHLKNMKKERGINNYELANNPNSKYHYFVDIFYNNPKLIAWNDFRKNEPLSLDVEEPGFYGIRPLLIRE